MEAIPTNFMLHFDKQLFFALYAAVRRVASTHRLVSWTIGLDFHHLAWQVSRKSRRAGERLPLLTVLDEHSRLDSRDVARAWTGSRGVTRAWTGSAAGLAPVGAVRKTSESGSSTGLRGRKVQGKSAHVPPSSLGRSALALVKILKQPALVVG